MINTQQAEAQTYDSSGSEYGCIHFLCACECVCKHHSTAAIRIALVKHKPRNIFFAFLGMRANAYSTRPVVFEYYNLNVR